MALTLPPELLVVTPLLNNGERFADLAIRSPTDSGPAKLRQRMTTGPRPLRVPYALTKPQVAALDNFYHVTTKNGVLRFEMPHPRTGADEVFRFLEPPELVEQHRGLYFTTLVLEQLP